jgi:hypothetical protein
MTIADHIYEEVQALPDALAREVLDFIGYIEMKYDLKSTQEGDLKKAQEAAMARVWDNRTDDEVWNDL